jgi:hypothetical protein
VADVRRALYLLARCVVVLGSVLIASAAPCGAEGVEAASGSADELSGREIYQRYLDNKYRNGIQKLKVISRDPGGSEQTLIMEVSLQDNRDTDGKAVDGVLARVLLEVKHPFDIRHNVYLMIARDPGPDEEFVYQASERRVKRVDLKRTPLLGTDYTFDDIAYHDVENATYSRKTDEVVGGVPVYVVESIVEETRRIEHHRTLSYIEKEHYIPLRIRYWDEFDVEIKEMQARHDSIRSYGETWIANESKMSDLLQGTSSTLLVESMNTNPRFRKKHFSITRLTQGQ